MLRDVYGVPESKIRLIPHGIPDLPFADSNHYKQRLGITGRRTILTFGLLGRNKGIQVMLRALPAIVRAVPSVLYIVLGATHPEVVRREGRSYKLELETMVRELGLQNHVLFCDRFVHDDELFEYLRAADIYVTPYLRKEQLTSGTLAFAVGAGKAVVSTPYWAAQELLAKGRGRLVRFGDSKHVARSVLEILGNYSLFSRMRRRAYEYGRSMTWPKVGRSYWSLLSTEVSSLRMPLERRAESQDWKLPAYGSQHIYQSA
jgi:glycosyltransferase involved in cell wall biosynthesis